MRVVENTFNTLLAPAEELWERGGGNVQQTEIEPGHVEDVPFFDLEVWSDEEYSREDLVTRRGRTIGEAVVHRIITSDGIDRLARTIRVNDEYHSESEFIVTDGTAWTTTINGYAKNRAERIAVNAGIDVIQVGAEHSTTVLPYGLDVFRLGRTMCNSRAISLAKTAQSEQLIIAYLAGKLDLPSLQYAIGDSRGSMKTPGQYPYASLYGNEIIHMDTKAPCVPEKLQPSDIPKFIKWLGTEALEGSVVLGTLAAKGKAPSLQGTVSLNPNFIVSSFVGIMPALASGEAGRMAQWVPEDAHGHIVIYDRDILSRGDIWDKQWSNHPNMHLKHVPRKTHAHLLESRSHDLQLGRIRRFGEKYKSEDGNLSRIDWDAVYRSDKPVDRSSAA